MKVYLAAENKELGIRLANIINRGSGRCIISDMESDDYKALLKDIKNSMEYFDLSILISGSPQEASMDANRINGIRAVVCKDLEDVSGAVSAKANLIVLDAAKLSRIDGNAMVEIFKSGLGSKESQPQKASYMPAQAYKQMPVQPPQKKPVQVQTAQQDSTSAVSNVIGGLKGILNAGKSSNKEVASSKPIIKKPEIKTKPAQQDERQKEKKKGGIFGSLKDTFGVD